MIGHTIQRDQLGSITKVGQGGQGIVYRAPGFKTKFTNSMVFKEYKDDARAEIDFDALSAMPVLVEDSMSYDDAARLISIAAWPCAIVERDGKPIGQVMPAIPDHFTMPLKTARGTSQVNAEFQHLLNHPAILAARAITICDVQRYSLLREVAAELAFLHSNAICVGDISPKNLLFALEPTEAAYFIDCDTMSINGVSALPQAETPGWEVPEGEPLATVYADSYKLGLLALRLLVGDQDVRDPKRTPARTPSLLRKIITDSLTNEPERRPLPTAWTYILGHAIEEAQQRELDASSDDEPDDVPAPVVPVVRSRPKPQVASKASASKPPPAPVPTKPATVQPATSPPLADSQRRNRLIGAGIAAVVVFALIVVMVAITNASSGTSADRSPRSSAPNTYDEPAQSTSRSSSRTTARSGGTWGDSAPSQPKSTAPAIIALSPPPSNYLHTGLDPNERACPPIALGRDSLVAARGSDVTSCYFAESVGSTYVSTNADPTLFVDISARGAVDCRDVPGSPKCNGPLFVMACGMRGNDRWITCTGGNRAVVYIY